MPRHATYKPDDDDDWDESGDGDGDSDSGIEGVYDDDGPPLIPCRYCSEEIPEDTEQCPYCHNYQSREDDPGERKSRGFMVMLVLTLIAAVLWIFL